MTDTDQGHSNLRGPDDALPGDATPTLTEPATQPQQLPPPEVLSTIVGAVTPGEVVHAEEVDQSSQATADAAQEAGPTPS